MTSFLATSPPSSNATAKAILADVTIVTAASATLAPAPSSLTRSASPVDDQCDSKAIIPNASPATNVSSVPDALTLASPATNVPSVPGGEQAFPPIASQLASFLQSAVAFVGDGCALVDEAEFRRRLDVCRACDRRAGRRCTACGCWIGLKARGRAFTCPLGRWKE